MLPTELGYEPVNNAEANIGRTDQIRHDIRNVWIGRIEALKRCDDQFGLTINLLATSLRIGNVQNRGQYIGHSEGRKRGRLKFMFLYVSDRNATRSDRKSFGTGNWKNSRNERRWQRGV